MESAHPARIAIRWILAVVSLQTAAAVAQELPAPIERVTEAGHRYEVQLPQGHVGSAFVPLVLLWSDPAELSAVLARAGFVVVRVGASPDAAGLGELMADLRRTHRIAQGGVHAAIARDSARALGALLAQRHEFQTVTVFGDAAGADLAAVRRLRTRRVHALATSDVVELGEHFAGLHRERQRPGPAGEVEQVLDSFHDAAAIGDEDRYFAILPDDAVFLGTDASERWTGAEFRAFAMPYFERASAWTYVPLQRHVTVAGRGDIAWFDEVLDNSGYGECRGSGVLVRREGRWVLRQYNLTVPVPNDLMAPVARRIRAFVDGAVPAVTTLLLASIEAGAEGENRLLDALRDVPLAAVHADPVIAERAGLGKCLPLPPGGEAAVVAAVRRRYIGRSVLVCVDRRRAAAMLSALGMPEPAGEGAGQRLLVITFGVDGPRLLPLRLP